MRLAASPRGHGRIPHLKANPPERDRSMIETATGIQPVIFCFSLSTLSLELSVKKVAKSVREEFIPPTQLQRRPSGHCRRQWPKQW